MINNFAIEGYVAKNVQSRTTQTGRTVTSFTVNCPRYSPQTQQSTPRFFECKYWHEEGRDMCASKIVPGARVVVCGQMDFETWERRDGSNGSKVVLNAKSISAVAPPRDRQQAAPAYQAQEAPAVDLPLFDEPIPF